MYMKNSSVRFYVHTAFFCHMPELPYHHEGSEEKDCGDEQFEIADTRSLKQMYDDIKQQGLWPVLNDYLYV